MRAVLLDKLLTFSHMGQRVPAATADGIYAYVVAGRMPGGCLEAILSNDLREAFSRADRDTTANMAAIVAFLYNHTPASCWGSNERVQRWVSHGGIDGLNHT